MTLEELIAIQQTRKLGNVHLVCLEERSFLVAHTDHERDMKVPLRMCHLHQWLEDRGGPPAPLGVYIATNDEGGWKLHPLSHIPFLSDGNGNGSSR